MNRSYIYNFIKDINHENGGKQKQNYVVLFFPYRKVAEEQEDIQLQLREYFAQNTLPDKLIVICFDFNKEEIQSLFQQDSEIYDYIPRFEYDDKLPAINVISLDKKGDFTSLIGHQPPTEEEIDEIYNRGLVKIFKNNGGLIIAQKAHHFVFPSGKHCDRFLRTGNVLLNGAEILFIASALVKHFKDKELKSIYCDTSSINSLAYAYVNLVKDLNPEFQDSVFVESFGSYKLFEESKFLADRNSLFLISSSTSGNILERMTDEKNKAKNIQLSNVAIIYGLGVKNHFREQLICDLTLNENNPEGFEKFDSYNVNKGKRCRFCEDQGSKALKVRGDVFLLEKPIVTPHLIGKKHMPKYLSQIRGYFNKPKKTSEPVIRCYHKEHGVEDNKYEIFVDISNVLEEWENHRDEKRHHFKEIFTKLEKYVQQCIPAAIKYMIVLPDAASRKLARVVCILLNEQGIDFKEENILGIQSDELNKIDPKDSGVIAVVGSSIVSGNNLLYLSRALRDYEQSYQRLFFLFLSRTENPDHLSFLESNLRPGELGANTNKVYSVYTIHCSREATKTPWHIEEEFIKRFQDFFEGREEFNEFNEFCTNRISELTQSGANRGLSNNLFFPNLQHKELQIRSGFGFAPYSKGNAHTNFINRSKQSEIYFIISTILNDMRNRGILYQGEYVRNLIDPGNFVRFNDGILQASILRGAKDEELDFRLSLELSLQMKAVLGDMIVHIEDEHAEALNEFFYAIAIKKLRLVPNDLQDCIELLEEQSYYKNNDTVLKGLVYYIKEVVLEKIPPQKRIPESHSVLNHEE